MIVINDRPHIGAEAAAQILREHTARGGCFIDLDNAIDYRTYFMLEIEKGRKKLATEAKDHFFDLSAKRMMDVMSIRYGQDRSLFLANLEDPRSKITTDKKILKPRIDEGYFSEAATEFLLEYLKYKGMETLNNNLRSYTMLPQLEIESFEGHRMGLARPEWTLQATGRIGSSNPNLQNIAKKLCDLITYPIDWTLVRADSGQIEPRIMYSDVIPDKLIKDLIILYDDAYYGMLLYMLMSAEDEMQHRNGKPLIKQEITEEMKQLRSQLKTMILAANYGGGLDGFDKRLAKGFINKIQQHPERQKLERKVRAQVFDEGVETFYSAFGSPITPESNQKYTRDGSKTWKNHVVRCGINNPIQATAADLMCESVYYLDKLIREEGSMKSWIGYYKHDESCTYLHKNDLHLLEAVKNCTAYQVKDWIPIYADSHVGMKEATEFNYKIAM